MGRALEKVIHIISALSLVIVLLWFNIHQSVHILGGRRIVLNVILKFLFQYI